MRNKVFDDMEKGLIPDEVVMIEWEDITQTEQCKLGTKVDLITFHSIGIIVYIDKKRLDLQQTWSFSKDGSENFPVNPSNLLLSLPRGVIKNIYRFSLTKEN